MRKLLRWLTPFAIFVAIGVVLWMSGPALWSRGRLVYWQHEMMKDPLFAGQVRHEAWVSNANPYWGWRYGVQRPSLAWQRYKGVAGFPGGDVPTIFVHELKSGRGESRLVVIEVGEFFPQQSQLLPRVVRPASVFSAPVEEANNYPFVIDYAGVGHVRFFSGQMDPTNPSHLTIQFDADGKAFRIDGYLRDDGHIDLSKT